MIKNLMMSTFLSLKAHKLRVFLTMLGIIIGISSVVTIASLGEGVRQETISLADTTNANEMKIQNITPITEENMYAEPTEFVFSKADMKRIQKIDGVASVLPNYGEDMGMGSSEMIYAEADYFGQMVGVQLAPYSQDENLAYGRNITPADSNRDVIVLSQDVFEYGIVMENPENLIGQAISLNGYMYEVIGIKEGFDDMDMSFTGGDSDYFSSFTSAITRASYNELTKTKPISSLKVKFTENADRLLTTDLIFQSLEETYPDEEGVFEEDRSNEEMQQQMEEYMAGIVGFLMAITAISLLVGGIGVMNIMYVSVTQRKREIGIRRAIGAKPKNILFQFVLEAGVITLIGGLIGLIFGYIIAVIVGRNFMQIEPILTGKSIFLSTSVSILTGLFFGIMPAISAARLDPIKAIYR